MRILYIAPEVSSDSYAVTSLMFLPHSVQHVTAEMSELLEVQPVDAVVLDASTDLSLAQVMRSRLTTLGISAPLLIALSEGGFTAASTAWGAADVFVATASPAEVDARLRMALTHNAALSEYPRSIAGETFAPTGGTGGAANGQSHDGTSTEYGPLLIDAESYTVSVHGTPVALTFKEFELLRFMATNPERVFTRTQLLRDVWGADYLGGTRTVDVHIRRLRAKLGPELDSSIHTVRNVGYRFSASDITAEDLSENENSVSTLKGDQ